MLTIVRHGETPANTGGYWAGSTDSPLSERGRRQAALAAAHLARTRGDAVAVYASPLQRARHTAEPIAAALGLELQLHEALQEYHLGSWEGLSYRELIEEHRLFERMHADPDWKPGGGESAREVAVRLGGALRDIATRHAGERAIVVTHAGALTLAFGWLVEGSLGHWRRAMDNAAVSELQMSEPPQLLVFNETAHLAGLDP